MALFSVACSYNELPDNLQPAATLEDKITLNIETRAETYKGEQLDQKYFVTAADLENFVNFRRTESKRSGFSVKEVKSYGFDSSQTLFYILNYDKGWEVVAADKRVQPTLAHGDEGTFTMDTDNEPMKFWMNMLADGVLQTRRDHEYGNSGGGVSTASTTSTNTTSSTLSAQNDNVDFWDSISSDEATRPGGLIPTPGPMQPVDGYYIYAIDTEVSYQTYTRDHLLSTSWSQDHPWNQFCPLKNNGSGERAPAGCVAISGSQMLYYLRNYYDLTLYAPTHCYYDGDIDDFYIYFDLYNTTIWDTMAPSYVFGEPDSHYTSAAMLIAYVGKLIDMTYGNTGSSASTMQLKEKVFSEFDITCSESDTYDYQIIKNNIYNNRPVILRATSDDGGHSWIADGYKYTEKTTITYLVRYETERTPAFLSTLDKDDAHFTMTSTSIVSKYLYMNWGWGSGYNNNWYSGDPNWTASGCTFDTDVKMVYNFQPSN